MSRRTGPRPLIRYRLDNGLRVVLAPDRRWGRVAVCMHYDAGFRDEPPGWEGVAHLTEHLLFEGSGAVPPDEQRSWVHDVGGIVNGTTHPDYTDFYQVVPERFLARALFTEADRMRCPLLSGDGLTRQLAEVRAEISGKGRRPYAHLPWPLLPQVLYDAHSDAHDGYGDPAALATVTPEECASFFAGHYGPDRAVLTVAGAFESDQAVELIQQWFETPIDRSAQRPLRGVDRGPGADRWRRWFEPDVPGPGVAVGLPIAGPDRDLDGYLARIVLAELFGAVSAEGDQSSVSVSCGMFGDLDRRGTDAMVFAASIDRDHDPESWFDAVRDRLVGWGSGDLPEMAIRVAAARSGNAAAAKHADLTTRTRALGRLELLVGRADLADLLPVRLAAVDSQWVVDAAAALGRQPAAAIVLEPGKERTRPTILHVPRTSPPHWSCSKRRTDPLGISPGLIDERSPRRPEIVESAPDDWLRVIAVGDERIAGTRLRLRVPLGPSEWADSRALRSVTALLADQLGKATSDLPGTVTATNDGQHVTVDAVVITDVSHWLDVLRAVLLRVAAVKPADLVRADCRGGGLVELADDIERTRWIPAADAESAETVACLRSVSGPLVVMSGDADPAVLAELARDSFDCGWVPAKPLDHRVTPPSGIARVRLPRGSQGQLLLARVESAPLLGAEGIEAARYLAAAAVGGYHGSRLRTQLDRRIAVAAGRDHFLNHHRAFVRLTAPQSCWAAVSEEVLAVLSDLSASPLSKDELTRVRRYCTDQVRLAHDSPDDLIEVVSALATRGLPARWLWELPAAIRDVDSDLVAAQAAALYDPAQMAGVALEPPNAELSVEHAERVSRPSGD